MVMTQPVVSGSAREQRWRPGEEFVCGGGDVNIAGRTAEHRTPRRNQNIANRLSIKPSGTQQRRETVSGARCAGTFFHSSGKRARSASQKMLKNCNRQLRQVLLQKRCFGGASHYIKSCSCKVNQIMSAVRGTSAVWTRASGKSKLRCDKAVGTRLACGS